MRGIATTNRCARSERCGFRRDIHRDKIHEIEAMGFTLPLYSKNGWYPFTK